MSIDHVPRHMRSLPRDLHGRPIPWFAWVGDDGRALVTVLDQEKWAQGREEWSLLDMRQAAWTL